MSSYVAPFVDETGLNLPSYADILSLFITNAQGIYGPGEYLAIDSPLYQLLSIIALATSDANSGSQLALNNFNPRTAIGAALSQIVAYNGIARKAASFSSCAVTITGTAGAVISNGQVRDSVPQQGVLWNLPVSLVIPPSGVLNTVAVCSVIGALNALPGQLNIIATPTVGWTAVTNPSPAVLGQPVETDSQLRTRQAISEELPSITTLAGTIAGIAAVAGVTRQNTLENPTSAVDANGNPPHSLTAVVEGGTDIQVATAIYNNRGVGCDTNGDVNGSPVTGTTTVPVTDPNSGVIFEVSFLRPTDVPIFVIVNVNPLAGYQSAAASAINTAIVNYLQDLEIGELVAYSALVAVAMTAAGNIEMPTFSITSLFLGIAPSPGSGTDIALLFYQVAEGLAANVQVNS